MCECKTEIEAKLVARLQEQEPEATKIDLKIGGYVFLFGDSVIMKPTLQIEGVFYLPTKAGGLKAKKIKQSMIASYCPFCGEKLSTESNNEH